MATTTSRLLHLLSLLQTRRDWPGAVLADRLAISHRTVRRDVDRLREMGYSIHATMGPDGGYRLDAGSELPPLLFDDDQVVAVGIGLQLATTADAGLGESALRALTTVRQVMPSRLRHRLDAVQFTSIPGRPTDGPSRGVSAELLMQVSAAIRARESLRFDYATEKADLDAGVKAPRQVEPHHLLSAQGRWYLVGWDADRADWRIFRVDRITTRSHTGTTFSHREVPGGDVREFVSARFKGSALLNVWPCRGTVILTAPASEIVPFAGDGIVEVLDAERCTLESGSWSWIALAASLGRFDVAVEVLDPPELAAAFGELSARYAAAATATRQR